MTGKTSTPPPMTTLLPPEPVRTSASSAPHRR